MAGTVQAPGKGVRGQYHPDAQGNYHTGNKFFDAFYKREDQVLASAAANPEVARLIASGGSGTVNKVVGDTDVKVENGVITHLATGGVWKPILAAGAVAATGGIAGAAGLGAGGGAVAPTVTATGGGAMAGLGYGDLLRYGLPIAGNIAGSLIQAHAAGAASDAEQKYLEEALAYQKESDLYTRTTEANRYGAYQGRIAPFIATGTSSNARMAALLGLPAPAGGSSGGGNGPLASQRVPTDPATQAAIRAELRATNSSDSPAAWDEYLASHGDSSVKNWSYWKNRIDTGEGVGKGYNGPPATASAPAVTSSPVNQPLVQMRAPTGELKAVPQSQVAHFEQLGAVRA